MASSTERIGVNHCVEIASGKLKQLLALQIKSGESWFKEEWETSL